MQVEYKGQQDEDDAEKYLISATLSHFCFQTSFLVNY